MTTVSFREFVRVCAVANCRAAHDTPSLYLLCGLTPPRTDGYGQGRKVSVNRVASTSRCVQQDVRIHKRGSRSGGMQRGGGMANQVSRPRVTRWTASVCLQDLWPCTFSMPASRFSFFLDQTRGLLIFSKHQLVVSLISIMLPTAFDLTLSSGISFLLLWF